MGNSIGTTTSRRALVAVSPAGQPAVRAHLQGLDADFVTTYPEAAAALTRRHYPVVIVGLHFAESHMLDMIQLARELEPSARIVAVTGSGRRPGERGLAGVQMALEALGVEGLLDLSTT